MSSRNRYLTVEQRRAAPVLYRALCAARDNVAMGERDPAAVVALVRDLVAREPALRLEYADCVDPDSLVAPILIEGPTLLAVAARIGNTRLIDNLILEPPAPERGS